MVVAATMVTQLMIVMRERIVIVMVLMMVMVIMVPKRRSLRRNAFHLHIVFYLIMSLWRFAAAIALEFYSQLSPALVILELPYTHTHTHTHI